MKHVFLLFSLSLLFCNVSSGQITIDITAPTVNQLTDDTLTVTATVTSDYSLESVDAIVNDRSISLSAIATNIFSGKLYLGGLPQDTLELSVCVKDIFDNRDTLTRKFVYDQMPRIIIDSPTYAAVANPLMRLKAHVVDSNTTNCFFGLYIISESGTEFIDSFSDNIADIDIDLSEWNGGIVQPFWKAKDSKGQTMIQNCPAVYVEASPYLSLVYSGQLGIRDFENNRLLVYSPSITERNYATPWIINLDDNDTTVIPFKGKLLTGKLSDSGILFGALDSTAIAAAVSSSETTTYSYLYAWGSDTLHKVPGSYGIQYLSFDLIDYYNHMSVSGNNGIWYAGGLESLHKFTFPQMTDTTVSEYSGNWNCDVTQEGDVVYWGGISSSSEYDIIKWRGNIASKVTNDNGVGWQNVYARTDGVNVLYQRRETGGEMPSKLVQFDGTDTVELATYSGLVTPESFYQVKNGYMAYIKNDISMVPQVTLKSPNGTIYTLTTVGSGSNWLSLLSPQGGVMYKYNATLNYADSTTRLGALASTLGTVYFYNETWYRTIGGNLYKFNMDTTSLFVEDMYRTMTADATLGFLTNEFKSTFSKPGHPVVIKIIEEPLHGILKYQSHIIHSGDSLFGGQISLLKYIPNSDFVGIDTFSWKAYDGTKYSVNNANVYINVERTSSIPARALTPGFLIYPNPSTGLLKIDASADGMFYLYSIDGRYIQKYKVAAGTTDIRLPGSLATGVYTGKFIAGSGQQCTTKIIYSK
ncbi:T9SS type A sorting domain-containing protein [Pedobacter panaciterrae]|uniref:T9SS type A sorting domain-containing protein n=1 Tax=Pedobacter panaciterrae TaxID=363849 RepID=UPI002595262A|nr:T9SS type A sorting domain-containing protein [uncultured Pedobacter sp.]